MKYASTDRDARVRVERGERDFDILIPGADVDGGSVNEGRPRYRRQDGIAPRDRKGRSEVRIERVGGVIDRP